MTKDTIDKAGSAKTYRVIIDYIRQGIEAGRLTRGQKLPSEKELCAQFNTSRSSVREALSALEYVGLVEVRGGSGYYVSGSLVVSPEEILYRSSMKVLFTVDETWNIKTIQTLFEMGLDGASLLLRLEDNPQLSRQMRAVRQAANDTGVLPALLAEIPAGSAERREEFAETAIRSGLDAVIVDATQNSEAIMSVRKVFDSLDTNILVLAKVSATTINLDEILQISDGLVMDSAMIANPPEASVADLTARANQSGKILLVAGTVNETMSVSGTSAQDLAQRVIQSACDGVLVTTVGPAQKFPLDLLNAIKSAAKAVEDRQLRSRTDRRQGRVLASPLADALCSSAIHAAQSLKAMAFIVPSETGFTPRLLAKFRQLLPVITVSPNAYVVRQLRLLWGVQPLLCRRMLRQEDFLQLAVDTALKVNYLREGDAIVGVLGNMDVPNAYNSVNLITVGDIILRGQGIGSGIVSGRVTIIKSVFDINKRVRNKIVVINNTDAEHTHLIEEAAGLIVEEGGLSSHAAVACLTLGKPVIVGAAEATDLLLEDEQITMDVMRGLVYRGWVNLG